VPLALAVQLVFIQNTSLSPEGIALAIISGAVTSALGYFIWYKALRGLTVGFAAAVQLAVPLLVVLGGGLLLNEALTPRLAIASVVTIGGIAVMLRSRQTFTARSH